MRPTKNVRKTNKTLLIVGEGDTEEAFLKHLKSLLVARDSGLSVAIKNAGGKGALYAINYTINQIGDYDCRAALFDTDTDWNQDVAAKARQNHIETLDSEPQIEAVFLRVLGEKTQSKSAAQLKKGFTDFLQNNGFEKAHFDQKFTLDFWQDARKKEPMLERLLSFLEGKFKKKGE